MKKVSILIVIIILVGAAASPWGLYAVALANINGRPVAPQSANLSETESKRVWAELKEHGPIMVEKFTPYRYVPILWDGSNEQRPGERLASFIALDYNHTNIKDRRALSWHFSGAALTIWLTRNWEKEQLLIRAKEILESQKAASNNTLNRNRAANAALSG